MPPVAVLLEASYATVHTADESAPESFQTTNGGRTWSPLESLAVGPGR